MKQPLIVLVFAMVIAGIVTYAAINMDSGPRADRNVPGATTGTGKSSLTD
jgi:hypothetical protein